MSRYDETILPDVVRRFGVVPALWDDGGEEARGA
jgi:hypothetical protein